MSTQPAPPRLGFGAQVRSYPRTFWVANSMETFERMAWYGIYVFAIGEMMASPTSQEFIGRIAPAKLARDAGRPDLMWLVFALMAFATAVALAIYNRTVVRSRGHAALA